jgi:hypothetical protein
MATTYKSTIELSCWKEHTCENCGTVFRYLFKRTKTGQAGSVQAAENAARAAVVKALTHEVDMQPCPTCGFYQADMVGVRRSFRHWVLFWIALACLAVVLFLTLIEVIPYNAAAWLAVVLFLGVVTGHLLIALSNPNGNMDANLQKAKENSRAGVLQVCTPGDPMQAEQAPRRHGLSAGYLVCFALMGLGVIGMASSELVRLARGWPLNKDWYPQVVGPGDSPYVYFPNKITSVKGFWQGRPAVTVENARDLGLGNPQLRAEAQNDNWGNTIQIGSKESKTSTKTLWTRVHFDPQLAAGKEVRLKIDLAITYPKLMGDKSWDPATEQHSLSTAVRLASPKAGSTYRSFFWWGLVFGGVLILTFSIVLALLARGLRNRALPTSVYPLEEGGGEG